MKGFAKAAKVYPIPISGFLFPALSEIQPEITLNKLAVLSATPSTSPIKGKLVFKTVLRNIGIIGRTISVLTSAKKLTKPR